MITKSNDTYRHRSIRKARATVAQGTEMDPGRRHLKTNVDEARRKARKSRKSRKSATAQPSQENVYKNSKSNIRYRIERRVEKGRTILESLKRISTPRMSKDMELRWEELGELGFEKPAAREVTGAAYFRNQERGVVNIPASPASFDQLVTQQSFVSKCMAEEFGSKKMRFVTDLVAATPYQEFVPDTAATLACLDRVLSRGSGANPGQVVIMSGFTELVICRFGKTAERDNKNTFIGDMLAGQFLTRPERHRRRNAADGTDNNWRMALPDADDLFYNGEKLWVVQHAHYNIGVLGADGRMVNLLKLGTALDLPSARFGILADVLGGKCEDQSRLSIGENARRTIQYAIKPDLRGWEHEERLAQLSWRTAAPNAGCFDLVLDNRSVKTPLPELDRLMEHRRKALVATGLQHNHPTTALDVAGAVAFYDDVAGRLNYSGHAEGIRALGEYRHYGFKG